MAESNGCQDMDVNEILALKEEIYNQKQLLQELYIDLEAERECSSTAARESLSMILRLQGELAVEKMESGQNKRMTESRMKHAEESMAVFEELLYWKEMEIASLKCQVQAYRYKMLTMGFSDLVIGDMKFHEHLLMPYTEDHYSNFNGIRTVRRNNSVPPLRFKDTQFEMGSLERDGSKNLVSELLQKKVYADLDREFDDKSLDRQKMPKESAIRDTRTYWKNIRQLVDRAKVLSHGKVHDTRADSDCVLSLQELHSNLLVYSDGLRVGPGSSLLFSDRRGDVMSDPGSKVTGSELDPKNSFTCSGSLSDDLTDLLDLDKSNTLSLGAKKIRNATELLSFHEKFEVRQTHENGKLCWKQEGEELVLECEKKLSSLHQNKSSKPSDEATVACHSAFASPTTDAFPSQTEFQWLNNQLELLKDEKMIVKQEASGGEEQQLRVLKEIHEQINTVRSEKRNSKARKCHPSNEFSLVSVMEVRVILTMRKDSRGKPSKPSPNQ